MTAPRNPGPPLNVLGLAPFATGTPCNLTYRERLRRTEPQKCGPDSSDPIRMPGITIVSCENAKAAFQITIIRINQINDLRERCSDGYCFECCMRHVACHHPFHLVVVLPTRVHVPIEARGVAARHLDSNPVPPVEVSCSSYRLQVPRSHGKAVHARFRWAL